MSGPADVLQGVYVANVTPFRDDDRFSIDVDAYLAHVRWLGDMGVTGVIPFGTNGEGPSVAAHEKRDVIGALVTEAGSSLQVVPTVAEGNLPDTLDLLAISVEAGVGFEGAMAVVCEQFDSPLADEFSRTLKEMELGLPRREALQNLKRRTEVPELSNFVLALTQADVLGMPVGRVLKASATEMRSKRRQWAREKAGKLPVKILFPLVLFIFPAVLVIVLGPAASDIAEAFK